MRALALLGLVYALAGCLSFEDTRLRVGVSYDHREGIVEGSQQFFPSATARVEENPVYGGWVEIDFPLGEPAVRPVELTNWRDLKPDAVPGTTVIHSTPDAKTLEIPAVATETVNIFGVTLPANIVMVVAILVLGGPIAIATIRHAKKKGE